MQQDIKELPYKVSEAPDGGILIHVSYLGEEQTFTPEQVWSARKNFPLNLHVRGWACDRISAD